ncbi:MAG: hypothetical protein CMJ18_12830 [Phycisphaeraceae bacterium]|nr:hypothetical protein [Phycisphaeraceae bacterium]
MTTAVVVDDLKLDRRLAGSMLEDHTDLQVVYAKDGEDALSKMASAPADVVLTDMQMPRMDGLALVEAVRRDYPRVPVILMTAHGSEDVAAEALVRGAASYVPKKLLARDLVSTVERVLAVAGHARRRASIQAHLVSVENRFVLPNDFERVELINTVRDEVARMPLMDETDLTRLGVALDEALSNAIVHGNLELVDPRDPQIAERMRSGPGSERHVHLTTRLEQDQVALTVRDEGPGFDVATLPDPNDHARLESTAGRGLILIRTFMDDVRFNEAGNEITLVKRRQD